MKGGTREVGRKEFVEHIRLVTSNNERREAGTKESEHTRLVTSSLIMKGGRQEQRSL